MGAHRKIGTTQPRPWFSFQKTLAHALIWAGPEEEKAETSVMKSFEVLKSAFLPLGHNQLVYGK
jgi:hypothetical protein